VTNGRKKWQNARIIHQKERLTGKNTKNRDIHLHVNTHTKNDKN